MRLLVGSLLTGLLCWPGQPALSEPLSLKQCYERAIAESNQLKIRGQEVLIAEAQYQQAMAELYPEIFLEGFQRYRDNEDFGSISSGSFDDPSSGMRRSRSLGRSQFEGLITVSQPLFRGFQELLFAEASKTEARSFVLEKERDRQLLLSDAADLYFQILLLQDQKNVISEIENTLRKRITELQEFLKLGKSRESEVLAAEGDVALQILLRTRTERALAAAREVMGSLIGIKAESVELAVAHPAGLPEPVETLLARLDQRPDLRAKTELQRSLELSAEAESRSYWPSLSLDSAAYPYEDPDRNRDWEVGLRLNVPIYQGGRIDARISEIEAQRGLVRYQQDEILRLAKRDLRESFQKLNGSLAEIQRAIELREKRRKNYESQRHDYTLGVVTNLEVLNALAELQNSELELLQARSAAALERVRLDVIVGDF
ncbi:MAG: hypothetical protein DCC75_05775 [Proteobacteria bacterium]|nr:MAG: hypothetical protein DCC75_05775 [Pseudomonadota bacterium]